MLAWLKSHPVHIAAVLTLASTLFFVPGMLVPDVIQLSFNVDFHQTQVNPNGGGGYPPNNSPMSLALSSEMPLTASLRTAHRLASSAILAAAQNGAAPAAGKNDEVGDSPTTTVDTTVFSDSFARWSYLQFSWQIDFSETVVITQDGEPSPQTSSMSIYTAGTTPMTSSCQVDLSQIVRDAIASSGLNSTQVDDIIAQMQQEDPDQWYALTHSPILDECSQWSAAFGIGLTAIGFSILLLVAEVFVIKSQHPIAVLVAPAVAVLAFLFALISMSLTISVRQNDKNFSGLDQELALLNSYGPPGVSASLNLTVAFVLFTFGLVMSFLSLPFLAFQVYQTRTQGGGGGRGGMGGSVQGMGLGEPLTSQDGVYRQM